jgi:hypothetical protein
MISHDTARHNAPGLFPLRRRPLPWLLTTIFLLLLAGCGGAEQEQAGTPEAKEKSSTAACPVVVDVSGWETFQALGDRLSKGEQVPARELEAFGSLPAITLWRESMVGNVPEAYRVGNWAEFAFWDEVGQGRPSKPNEDRMKFGPAMRFSYDNRQEINELISLFAEQDNLCSISKLASYWLDADKKPDPLTVSFVAGKPELRSHHGQLIADTGLLLAGGQAQLGRQLVAILYRERQVVDGKSPLDLTGAESIANTLRVMMNTGIASWIEDMPNTYFRPVHPRLGQVTFVPENIFTTGIRGMNILSTNLPEMFADEAVMTQKGQSLSRAITGSGALTQGGYCMAAVIVNRLGEDKLRAVRNSPPAFLKAYQQAASLNTLPLPQPGEIGRQLHETMPAFPEDVYLGLLKILEEYFPGC